MPQSCERQRLLRQITEASNVHFDSIFVVQQHSLVSSIPSIVLAPIPYPSEYSYQYF